MINKIKYFKDKPIVADIIDLLIICLVTFILGKLLVSHIVLTGYVPSSSMETLIMTDDRILADRMAYWNAEPKRGDIVVFYAPDDKQTCTDCLHTNDNLNPAYDADEKIICAKCNKPLNGTVRHFVKRVIGVPGDTVSFSEGFVYINGSKLDEPYISQQTYSSKTFTVPEGCYFMLGDNRGDSKDSREWINPYVPKKEICGKVFLKFSIRLDNLHVKIIKSYDEYDESQ